MPIKMQIRVTALDRLFHPLKFYLNKINIQMENPALGLETGAKINKGKPSNDTETMAILK